MHYKLYGNQHECTEQVMNGNNVVSCFQIYPSRDEQSGLHGLAEVFELHRESDQRVAGFGQGNDV